MPILGFPNLIIFWNPLFNITQQKKKYFYTRVDVTANDE